MTISAEDEGSSSEDPLGAVREVVGLREASKNCASLTNSGNFGEISRLLRGDSDRSSSELGPQTSSISTPEEDEEASSSERTVRRGGYKPFDSAIQYIDIDDPVPTSRLGHLMVLLPLTGKGEDGSRSLIDFRVYIELSAFLAFKQFQHRSDQILVDLPELLDGCDFTWTYEHHDTQFSPIEAARALSDANGWHAGKQQQTPSSSSGQEESNSLAQDSNLSGGATVVLVNNTDVTSSAATPPGGTSRQNQTTIHYSNATTTTQILPPQQRRQPPSWAAHPNSTRKPFAILGAARSTVSQTLGILGSALQLPQISSSSTASILDESSYFARTIPTNDGDAHAMMAYLKLHLGVTHVCVLFLNDSWGRRYEQDIQYFANIYGVKIESVAYEDIDHLDQAMSQLEEYGYRYFIGLISSGNWKPVIRKAKERELIGNPMYQWFFGDLVEWVTDSFALNRATERDIADALHGVGMIFLRVQPHEPFDRMMAAFADNKQLQEEFIASHAEPHLLENFTFDPFVGRSLFQYLTFDATVALGLTACKTKGLFTGSQFYRNLLQVDFEGVSGRVTLNEKTGTRMGDTFQFQVVNLVLNDSKLSPDIYFYHDPTAFVDLSPTLEENENLMPIIEEVTPFLYQNNSTKPPIFLPPISRDMNLIPNGVRYFGLLLCIFTMLLSVACGVWTYFYRNEYVIRASQPVFLYQLCLGCFVVSTSFFGRANKVYLCAPPFSMDPMHLTGHCHSPSIACFCHHTHEFPRRYARIGRCL